MTDPGHDVDATARETVLPATLVLENFLAYRLRRIADAVSLRFSRVYRERHGLTRPDWRALATPGQFGPTTATALGLHSAMHKTKVSRAVGELERRRWLTRSQDTGDRRIEHLSLTPAGLAAYRELVPLAQVFENALLDRMTPSERAAVSQRINSGSVQSPQPTTCPDVVSTQISPGLRRHCGSRFSGFAGTSLSVIQIVNISDVLCAMIILPIPHHILWSTI